MSAQAITIASASYPNCRADVRISGTDGTDFTSFFIVSTGASRLQTYITAAELRALATMALGAAVHLDALAAKEAA